MPDLPDAVPERAEWAMSEVWACDGCGRIGHSARDLLQQGCEGRPERYLPATDLEQLRDDHVRMLDKAAAECVQLRERYGELEAALPDPDKLDLLADWIDARFPDDANPEVQRDLRAWATAGRAALRDLQEGRDA